MNGQNIAIVISVTGLVLQLVAVVFAGITLAARLKKDREEFEKSIKQENEKLRSEVTSYVKELTETTSERISEIDDRRRGDVRALHERINNLENQKFTEVIDRLSKIEGELKGINNITRIVQEHYMKG